MLIAMLVGMVALGCVIEGALTLAGGSLTELPASLGAAVMAVNMTVPMIWWMHHRGHPARHNVEMVGSMVVPTAVVIALDWLGTIPSSSVIMAQHMLMIPAMVGVMLWRYDHYSH
jgi:flagellar biosynthetic protein FliP